MKIRMINSVGEHEAGTEVDVDEATGNRFIALGYADGEPTQDLSVIREGDTPHQVVSLGG
jgi:hypothetical protein